MYTAFLPFYESKQSLPHPRLSLGFFHKKVWRKSKGRKKKRANHCYASAQRARKVGGAGRTTLELSVFPEVPPSRERADAASLPHLSSPLPVPLRVSVPGWCFLVAAASVSMCVTDPEPPTAGRPWPAFRVTRRAVEVARAASPASAPPAPSHLCLDAGPGP